MLVDRQVQMARAAGNAAQTAHLKHAVKEGVPGDGKLVVRTLVVKTGMIKQTAVRLDFELRTGA